MAMVQHMAVRLGVRPLAERQQPLDMGRRAGFESGIFRHDVVEADQLMVDVEELVERRRAWLVGVDDRQHMAHAGHGMLRQLGNAADDQLVVGQGHAPFYNRPRARCSPTPSIPKMKMRRKVSGRSLLRALSPSQTPAMVGATATTAATLLVA